MKAGDIVRINYDLIDTSFPWPESIGEIGVIVEMTKRLFVPAANVMVLGEVAEFDLDELEVINESR